MKYTNYAIGTLNIGVGLLQTSTYAKWAWIVAGIIWIGWPLWNFLLDWNDRRMARNYERKWLR